MFDFFLPGYINFLPIAREEVVSFTSLASRYLGHDNIPYWLRFRSVLGEPSQIGLYVGLVYYCLALLGEKLYSYKMLLLGVGLILSFSGVAFALLLYTGFYTLFINKNLGKKVLYIICFIPFFIILMNKFPIVLDIQKSIFDRLNAYLSVQNVSVFGIGYSKDLHISWSPSLWRIFNAFGLIGFIALIFYFLSSIKFKTKHVYSFMLILFVGFGSELLVSYWILIWYPLLFRNKLI